MFDPSPSLPALCLLGRVQHKANCLLNGTPERRTSLGLVHVMHGKFHIDFARILEITDCRPQGHHLYRIIRSTSCNNSIQGARSHKNKSKNKNIPKKTRTQVGVVSYCIQALFQRHPTCEYALVVVGQALRCSSHRWS